MYVVFVERLIKVNTGSVAQYAPRAANQRIISLCGPFVSPKTAARAVLAALSSHTCLSARIVSEAQIRAGIEKGSMRHRTEEYNALVEAATMIDALADSKPKAV